MAAGAGVPSQRDARGGLRRMQAREGGRGRRAVPAQSGPRRARRVRGAAPRALRHVRALPRRRPRRRRAGLQAPGCGHRRRVRAHLRGQGRRLDARRGRPMEDVRRVLQAHPTHEDLRGRQLSSKAIIPMITRRGLDLTQSYIRCALEEAWLIRSSMYLHRRIYIYTHTEVMYRPNGTSSSTYPLTLSAAGGFASQRRRWRGSREGREALVLVT